MNSFVSPRERFLPPHGCFRFLRLLAACLFFAAVSAEAAQVGVKYNRPKHEYPEEVLADFKRFKEDRIRAVMISLPWSSWEPWEHTLDEPFIRTKLAAVLQYSYENGIRVILSSHCSFWGSSGNWTVPGWVTRRDDYRSATSVLLVPEIRKLHSAYLKRLIDATSDYPAVEGYSLLNEPAVATRWYVENAAGRAEFEKRWEGVLEVMSEVRAHADQKGVKPFLIFGNGNADEGLEAFIWKDAGNLDLSPLWSREKEPIAAQGVPALLAAQKWYPGRASLRTEGALTYAVLQAWREAGDVSLIRTRWLDTSDASAVTFDYDAVYDYEGLANAAVPGLKAFYVWRVGSIEGSSRLVSLLHHRDGDRSTPYYAALRDLASGIDSFETLGGPLPASGKAALEFHPDQAAPAVSKRWQGTGRIEASSASLPPAEQVESRFAAVVKLGPGQAVFRSVIAAHWRDSGVSPEDSLTFWAYTEKETAFDLTVSAGEKRSREKVTLQPLVWKRYSVPFKTLGITDEDIPAIQSAGFENSGETDIEFLVDEFLIR